MVLQEKCFRRVEKFEGELLKFRGWLFDFLVAISQVGDLLARELNQLLSGGLDEKWYPETDTDVCEFKYGKYSFELYGLLCSLTTGEAKTIIKGMVDLGSKIDGSRAGDSQSSV